MKFLVWLIAVTVGSCVGTSVVFAIQDRNLPCLLLAFGLAAYIIGERIIEDLKGLD